MAAAYLPRETAAVKASLTEKRKCGAASDVTPSGGDPIRFRFLPALLIMYERSTAGGKPLARFRKSIQKSARVRRKHTLP